MRFIFAYIILFFVSCSKYKEPEPIIQNVQIDMRSFPGRTIFTIYNQDTAYVFDSDVKKFYETFIPDTGKYSIQWQVTVTADNNYESVMRSFETEVRIPYENYIFVGHDWPVHTLHYFSRENK